MKNFEKEARNQLDQHKSSLEIKPIWEKINLELRPQRKKPGIFWWPLGISLFGLSLFIILNTSLDKTNPESIPNNLSSNESNITSVNNNKLLIKKTNSTNTTNESNLKANSNNNISRVTIIREGKINSKNSSPRGNSYRNKTKLVELNNYNKTSSKNDNLINSDNSNINGGSFSSNAIYTENATSLNNTNNLVVENKNDLVNLNKLDNKISLIQASNTIESITSIQPLYQNYKKDKFSLYMSIYGGYGYPIRSLAAKESNSKVYEDSRIATETTLDVLQFGLLIGSKTFSGLFVESGFEYNRINERFDWNKTVTDTIGKYVITGYILNAPGDTSFLKDSIDILRISNYNKKIYNNYSFYSIPIIVGYEFNRMARTRFYVKAGVLVNLRLDNKVAMLDESGLPNDYENGPNTMFKSKIGFTPFVSAGVKYSFNNTIELFGELNYKYLNDISENSYTIKQSYNLLSANIGLQFNF